MNFNIKNTLDFSILISIMILILTGVFLRFFKYFFTPVTTEKLALLLIPEMFIALGLITIKLWRK
ncbi:hypothetical protein C3L23_09435 [Nautilia sp. PV-1]|uniref:hypothetical protein n=1 Tax=Nautilia sp. PV-1 TaxID=2579250 RepID=UPI000FD7393B|nr:hypothetical protein [Nautilia sp. PV-1]AZV47478.1 hypothetical protein C3L23_09435 [Nautilia sp. PV-1]